MYGGSIAFKPSLHASSVKACVNLQVQLLGTKVLIGQIQALSIYMLQDSLQNRSQTKTTQQDYATLTTKPSQKKVMVRYMA